jgi:hypothetical protein
MSDKRTVSDKLMAKRRQTSKAGDKKIYTDNFPLLWSLLDLDKKRNWILLVVVRVLMAIFMTWGCMHADEYWQATQPAYTYVYGKQKLPWEWSD